MKKNFNVFKLGAIFVLISSFSIHEFDLCNKDKVYATQDYLYGDSYFKDYEKVKKKPKYTGGAQAIQKFFDTNVVLPEEASKIAARYHIIFIVNCKGQVGLIELKSKPFPGYEEIIKACQSMPDWEPAIVKKESVDCYVRLGFTNQAGKLKVDYREE